MRHSKPAGHGHPPQSLNPASDYDVPNMPVRIVRYGPNSDVTDTPASRVANAQAPATGGGLKRYFASTDGSPIHIPKIDRASKWDHGHGQQDWNHRNSAVAKTGRSQNPKQVYLKHSGKKTGD